MFISSADLSIPNYFEGYAWVKDDLVVGQGGADEFASQTGSGVRPDEDGCYVSVQQSSAGVVIGTDYRGLMRLFTYKNGSNWAIASSLYELISNVRQLSWPLTALEDTIAAYVEDYGFAAQLAAFGVHFAEVSLVPSAGTIIILDNRMLMTIRQPLDVPAYEVALTNFLTTWKNRLSTITSSTESVLKFDLSGGIDSRTVIAFALENSWVLENGARIESSTKPRAVKDFEVASIIAREYGFELNSKDFRFRPPSISAEEVFTEWKHHSLGVYSPVYLYNTAPDCRFVHAHGAGGGNFRPTYKSVKAKAAQVGSTLSNENRQIWGNRVMNDITSLVGFSTSKNLELLHYREFRNRFHFGHRPQQNLVYMPLESKLTDPITDREDDRDGRQFYFDVMESLSPGLSTISYDEEDKSPTELNISRLTKVNTPPAVPGTIYSKLGPNSDSRIQRHEAFDFWIDKAASRRTKKHVTQALPRKYWEAIEETISDWELGRRKKTLSNSLGMRGLSHVLTLDFLLSEESGI